MVRLRHDGQCQAPHARPSGTSSPQQRRIPTPVSPYPPSAAIPGVGLDWSTYRRLAPGSDQWPMTWAADGTVYASFQDGGGFGTAAQVRASVVSIGLAALAGTGGGADGLRWTERNIKGAPTAAPATTALGAR